MPAPRRAAEARYARLDQAGAAPPGMAWAGEVTACGLCARGMAADRYMIDGPVGESPLAPWATMCVECGAAHRVAIGWGKGQLYRRHADAWVLVAGGPPDTAT